jgi:excisionase family DNA binding protein
MTVEPWMEAVGNLSRPDRRVGHEACFTTSHVSRSQVMSSRSSKLVLSSSVAAVERRTSLTTTPKRGVAMPSATDETVELRAALERDEAAWRRFVARYDGALRSVVRHAAEHDNPLSEDQVDEVLGDFWLAIVANDMSLLRRFNPARGASLLTWLTFHVAQIAYEHLRRLGEQPTFVPLHEARHVAAPAARPSRLRNEAATDHSIEGAIRSVVRDAIASEMRNAFAGGTRSRGSIDAPDEGFISIDRAAKIADIHPATIRAWVRSGRLAAGKAGRHYKVRRTDVIKFIESPQAIEIEGDNRERIAAIIASDRGF